MGVGICVYIRSMWVSLNICVFYDLTLKPEYYANCLLVDKEENHKKRKVKGEMEEKWAQGC